MRTAFLKLSLTGMRPVSYTHPREQIEDHIKLKKILIMLTQTLLLKIQKFGDHQLGDTKKYMGMMEQFQN